MFSVNAISGCWWLNCAGVELSGCLNCRSAACKLLFQIQSANDLFVEADSADEVIEHPVWGVNHHFSSLLQTKQLIY